MKLRRFLCVALAALMLIGTFTACGVNDEKNENSTQDGEDATVAETLDPAIQDALSRLTNVNWGGGDFGVLYVNDIAGYAEEVEAKADAADQSSSAVINDAVYERNVTFEERCQLKFVTIPVPHPEITSKVISETQTNTGDFAIISCTASQTASMASSGYLYNYLSMDIDYDQQWWDPGTLDFALDGNVFFMNGAHNIVDDDVTFVMMFNKKMQSEKQVADPYTTVRNKEWTLEYFNSIIQSVSAENGDGAWDEKDTYGFSSPSSIGNTFFYGADLKYVNNSRDVGVPELALGDKLDKAAQVMDLAQSIVHENNASYIAKQGNEAVSKDVFVEGRALFYCEAASYLRALNQTMEGDYGVVPVPKYSKEQENYTTWTHSIGSTMSIPTSIADEVEKQMFAEVLETYVVLSYQLVKPAYYDTMLTSRNVRDPDSAEMLDLIFQNRTYDMAIYFDALGFSSLFSDCVTNNSDDFASKYAANSKRFDRQINNILKKINK
ncbi:MAG: hypothetical protein E7661_04145 [Ruminococcaceae bacterium]|nr:hypothetical protein [Oscillospiraceae bacterium]